MLNGIIQYSCDYHTPLVVTRFNSWDLIHGIPGSIEIGSKLVHIGSYGYQIYNLRFSRQVLSTTEQSLAQTTEF